MKDSLPIISKITVLAYNIRVRLTRSEAHRIIEAGTDLTATAVFTTELPEHLHLNDSSLRKVVREFIVTKVPGNFFEAGVLDFDMEIFRE